MSKTVYVQRKRTKGFFLQDQSPDGRPVVSCTRPGPWGNPHKVGDWMEPVCDDGMSFGHEMSQQEAVELYRDNVAYHSQGWYADKVYTLKEVCDIMRKAYEDNDFDYLNTATIRHHLSGKHLACFCKVGDPCHVQDVLLPIINGEEPKRY